MPQLKHASKPSAIPELVTIDELAEQFKVSYRTIRGWIERGEIPPPQRVGRRLMRWRVDVIQTWITAGCPRMEQEQNQ